MFTSPARFLLTLAAVFALLTTMWVSAARASDIGVGCRNVGDGITVCDGAGWRLPSAPRGTARRLAAPSVAHRAAAALAAHRVAHQGRVGHTVIVARLGAR